MRLPSTRKLISSALALSALACLWVYFAPAALGGSTSYVVTEGVSMEPRFHTGDLAVVRSQNSYRVGEIVAYYNKEFHTIVLHRIVGRDGARYVFKGDNNNFEDFEHPARSQLLGALWLHIPGLGGTLESVRSPALVGILAALGTLLLTGGVFTRRRRRRRAMRIAAYPTTATPVSTLPAGTAGTAQTAKTDAGARAPGSLAPTRGMLVAGTLALLPFVLLAMLAFTRPPDRRGRFTVPYEQTGTLTYSAHAAPGPTYANGIATTGEPLFTHVVHTAEVSFAYELHTASKHALAGTASLNAEVASSSGWKTVLPLGSPTRFSGDTAVVSAPLELGAIEELVQSVEETTGVGGALTLTLLPTVSIGGSVSTLPLHTTFSQQSKFTLTALELNPAATASSSLGDAGGSGGQPSASTFTQTSPGSVTGERIEPLALSFGVARLGVDTARAVALGGMGVVILLLLVAAPFVRPRPRDEVASIRARYGRLIVPVARVAELPGVAVIDVADMDALARLAEHYDRSILHESNPAGEAFWVTDESGQFRYVIGAPATAAASPDASARPSPASVRPATQGTADPSRASVEPPRQALAMVGEEPTREFAPAHQDVPAAPPKGLATAVHESLPAAPPESLPAAPPQSFPTAPPESLPSEDRTAAFEWPPERVADEVYEDELELAAIGYESGRPAGRARRSRTSLSLPAWSGWAG